MTYETYETMFDLQASREEREQRIHAVRLYLKPSTRDFPGWSNNWFCNSGRLR